MIQYFYNIATVSLRYYRGVFIPIYIYDVLWSICMFGRHQRNYSPLSKWNSSRSHYALEKIQIT